MAANYSNMTYRYIYDADFTTEAFDKSDHFLTSSMKITVWTREFPQQNYIQFWLVMETELIFFWLHTETIE